MSNEKLGIDEVKKVGEGAVDAFVAYKKIMDDGGGLDAGDVFDIPDLFKAGAKFNDLERFWDQYKDLDAQETDEAREHIKQYIISHDDIAFSDKEEERALAIWELMLAFGHTVQVF